MDQRPNSYDDPDFTKNGAILLLLAFFIFIAAIVTFSILPELTKTEITRCHLIILALIRHYRLRGLRADITIIKRRLSKLRDVQTAPFEYTAITDELGMTLELLLCQFR